MKIFKVGSIVRAQNGNEYKIVDFCADEYARKYYYIGEEVGRDADVLDCKVFYEEEEIDDLELVSAPPKTYKLTEKQLLNLLEQAADLMCLYGDGVDNWQGYHENMEEFCAENGVDVSKEDYDFEDVARIWINEYEEL